MQPSRRLAARSSAWGSAPIGLFPLYFVSVSVELSVVILCYRAEKFVPVFVANCIDVLEGAGLTDYELILVGNYVEGSGDRTPDFVREVAARHPRVRHCAEPKQGWMGWDVRMGLEMAMGRYVTMVDGDGQMPVEDIVAVYQRICGQPLDLVKTYRTTRGDGPLRKALSYVFNLLFHTLFPGVNARDINSKPKILTRDAYATLDLRSDDWFIDAEIMIQAKRHGFRTAEVPTSFLGLSGRRSFISVRAVFEFLWNLVHYRIRELFR